MELRNMVGEVSDDIDVYITLGSGVDLGISKGGHLIMTDYTNYKIDLGRATQRRFNLIQEYIERLKIHSVPEVN